MVDMRADAERALRILTACRRAAAELRFVEAEILSGDDTVWSPERKAEEVGRSLKQAGIAVTRAYVAYCGSAAADSSPADAPASSGT